MRHLVVGTAGHIDHGKSALVRALTGIDPDRLEEEKRRGITIDLGFADLDLSPDGVVSFVDVPGHERFVRHMVAGASGIDAVMLVVAADEGVKPQTREHVAICELLGIDRGLVVLTKVDLADPDIRGAAQLEVRDLLAGTFLAAAPMLAVSARTGEGIEALRGALAALLRAGGARPPSGVPRLAIDRSFVLRGFGTVVTGTLVSGTLQEGDEIEILPGGRRGRIRGLQVHRSRATEVPAGRRVAVNLQGLTCDEAPRGATLTRPGALRPTRAIRAAVELLPHAPDSLRKGGPVRFHHGTCERAARLRVLGRGDGTGGAFEADIVIAEETVLLPGDRFVLRRSAPVDTVGGGVVLDAHPVRGRRRADAAALPGAGDPAATLVDRVARAGIAGRPAAEVGADLGLSAGEVESIAEPLLASGDLIRSGGRLIGGKAWREAARSVGEALGGFHREEPLRAGMPRELLRARSVAPMSPETFRDLLGRMADAGEVRLLSDRVAAASHRVVLSASEANRKARIDGTFREAGLNPPALSEVLADAGPRGERLVELLLEEGRLAKIRDGRVFHAEALDALRRKVKEYGRSSRKMDVGTFKEIAGVTRKNAIPLLEQLDAERVTRRDGNLRVILDSEAVR